MCYDYVFELLRISRFPFFFAAFGRQVYQRLLLSPCHIVLNSLMCFWIISFLSISSFTLSGIFPRSLRLYTSCRNCKRQFSIVVFSIAICYAIGLYLSFMISFFDFSILSICVPQCASPFIRLMMRFLLTKEPGGVLYRWINP